MTLHQLFEAFAIQAGEALRGAASDAGGVPFEVAELAGTRRNTASALYCYRPLTSEFVRAQAGLLAGLPAYAPLSETLVGIGGLDHYLKARVGGTGASRAPADDSVTAGQAHAVLLEFVSRLFDERTDFEVDRQRFALVYEDLERLIYESRCVTEVIAPLHGVDLLPEVHELPLGDGLAIVRADALIGLPLGLAEDSQRLLVVLRVAHERQQAPPAAFVRSRFQRVLTTLRLFDRGSYGVGPIGYSRLDDGAWTPLALGTGSTGASRTLITQSVEDELREFHALISRRIARGLGGSAADDSGAGGLAWALARYEMGCERGLALERLTDHLLALRALLEPEGPASGRLTQRVSAICAPVSDRAKLSARVARAVRLERSAVTGMADRSDEAQELVDEISEHLRAILRDVICGHLDTDLCALADDLLGQAAEQIELAA
ncbi:MAG: hypothetical protein ACP5H2_07170 [Solirubrobacteraceae bacterium]